MEFRREYVPIIKTTDAELRGYQHLSESVKDSILPFFELTRSRATKSWPRGDISRRMLQIEEIIGKDRPFVLDLTSHDDLWNEQIERLLDDTDSFLNWYEFLCEYEHLNICPAVHAYAGGEPRNIVTQASRLHEKFGCVAFRFAVDDGNLSSYLPYIFEGLGGGDDVILVLDWGYLPHDADVAASAAECLDVIKDGVKSEAPGQIALASSSFPKSVMEIPGCRDSYGEIGMKEVDLFQALLASLTEERLLSSRLTYGDFASIHPYRYETRGGTWVPRVDVPLDRKYMYTRFRREKGGYIRAAEEMLEDRAYDSIGSWGDDQIANAASGKPNGLSPSFWIAVRMNIHLTRKVLRIPSAV